jgi:hypothetical protein
VALLRELLPPSPGEVGFWAMMAAVATYAAAGARTTGS